MLLAWLVIWEFNSAPRVVAHFARACGLVIVLHQASQYQVPPPIDYKWLEHVEPVRKGVPASIPTLPEGWTLEYRGRPASKP